MAFVSSVGKVHIPRYPGERLAPSTGNAPAAAAAANGDGEGKSFYGESATAGAPTGPVDNVYNTDGMTEEEAEEPLSAEFRELLATITRAKVDENQIRCPHQEAAERMRQRILLAKANHDSIGGTVTCVIRRVPSGLGEPCFDKLEAKLAHAMLSIPATKGFEIGSGFRGTEVAGSRHNDKFILKQDGRLGTVTNWSGGIQGGITNGEDIYFRVGFKSPATISQNQATSRYDGTDGVLNTRGRHDPCVVPRAVPIVEAMAALVIMDALLAQDARTLSASRLSREPVAALPASMRMPYSKKRKAIEEEVVAQQ